MRLRNLNAVIRTLMAAALLVTGYPLLRPFFPGRGLAPAGALAGWTFPGRIEVDAKDSLTPTQLQALSARYGLSFRYNSAVGAVDKLLIADVPPGQEAALVARLRKDPLVEAADLGARYAINKVPNDPRYPEQWNMRMIGAEKAWDTTAGKGVTVAVIDTGVAIENDDHGCYQAKDFSGTPFTAGYNFVNDTEHPDDDHGHGTHVAGTIAETTNNGEGVASLAYEATIMPLKVLDDYGSGSSADIADAIRFAADHGAKVINMSLGGPFPNEVMRSACRYAAKKGVLIVCAAGNSSGGPVGYPAGFPECLAVSAVGPTGELAPYSSIGKEVAIAAPGGYTRSGERPQDGILQNTVRFGTGEREDVYAAFNGTSMASPHVAAAAALAISRGVTDPGQVRQLLLRAATKKGPAKKYGAGILNAAKTVDLAGSEQRDSLLLLLVSAAAGACGLGFWKRAFGWARLLPLGFVAGLLGPDACFGWLGFASPWNIVIHSALIPLYLLWEVESGLLYRLVSFMAAGFALHLGWDALRGVGPFWGIFPAQAMAWMWVNFVIAASVSLVAWRRSFAAA
jgi:serine protease